jgi:transposase
MAAFSLDLRRRVLDAALVGDATERAVADRFRVSRSFVQKLKRLHRAVGSVAPSTARRGPRPLLTDADRAALAAWVEAEPDAPCDRLAARLAAERGRAASRITVSRALAAMGLTLKKRRSGRPSASGPTSPGSGPPS